MKKVLILTYYWPPSGGSGVQRWLKFVKYLPGFGFAPYVITPDEGSFPTFDESLLADIPTECKVFKTKVIEPFRIYNFLRGKKGKSVDVGMIGIKNSKSFFQKFSLFVRANFFLPDARVGWTFFAYKKALALIKKENISLVITTGPPHSTHLIGYYLKQKCDIKWFVDLRDPWTNIYYNKELPRLKYAKKIDQDLETKIIKRADHVLTVSEGLKNEFIDRNERITVIPNGFDEDDLHHGEILKSNYFTLLFTGNFVPFYNSPGLWEALRELNDEIVDFKKLFRLDFTGKLDPHIYQELEKVGLKDLVIVNDFIPHKEVTKKMFEANALLFILANDPNNKLLLSGKLFEYLASTTPMISIGPVDGDAAKVLLEMKRDKMFDYNDKANIKAVIEKYFRQWKENNGVSFKYSEDSLKKLTRKSLTKELADLLDS